MQSFLSLLGLGLYRWAMVPVRRRRGGRGPDTFVFRFHPWKTWFPHWVGGRQVKMAPYAVGAAELLLKWFPLILAAREPRLYVWSYREPRLVGWLAARLGVPLVRVEDGFLRSVSLGASHSTPLSLCIDEKALYFDATRPSSLEDFLQTHPFTEAEIARGRALRETLLSGAISKYNLHKRVDLAALLGPKTRPRVLVVGQVEGDMSILLGCDRAMTNTALVRLAAEENPEAEILFKPHPEAAVRRYPPQSRPEEVAHLATILDASVSLADAFGVADRVYTITSLAGFEALWRGLPVTCVGAPFYSGWGLTDDRQTTGRRSRRLTVDEVLYAAYVWYPAYRDPDGRPIEAEAAVALLTEMRAAAAGETPRVDALTARVAALEAEVDRLSALVEAATGAPAPADAARPAALARSA